MERLTQWFGSGRNRIAGLDTAHEEKYTTDELIDVLLNRLAAYEDSGLEPGEIRELAAAHKEMAADEAIEILENGEWWVSAGDYIPDDELGPLCDAVDMAVAALRARQKEG